MYNVNVYIHLHIQKFYKLICLHLPTDCFMKISLQSSGSFYIYIHTYNTLYLTKVAITIERIKRVMQPWRSFVSILL